VRLGTVEGVVQEVTLNYSKVLTIGKNTVAISNLQILDRDITNYRIESPRNLSLFCYTFEIGFSHSVSTEKIAAIFNEVFERIVHTLPRNRSQLLPGLTPLFAFIWFISTWSIQRTCLI